jgi:hypothetical protein
MVTRHGRGSQVLKLQKSTNEGRRRSCRNIHFESEGENQMVCG